MPKTGKINLTGAKALYDIQDIQLVNKAELDIANNDRLYFEIGFGIGLAIFGSLLTTFSIPLLITCLIFSSFGIFALIKYLIIINNLYKKAKAK